MSKLRELIEKAPELAGIQGAHAKRAAKALLYAFDAELADKDSVFAAVPGESIEDRMFLLRLLFIAPGVNWSKASYIIELINVYAHSCAVAKGRKDLEERRNMLAGALSTQESSNLEVAEVMTVADAASASRWG